MLIFFYNINIIMLKLNMHFNKPSDRNKNIKYITPVFVNSSKSVGLLTNLHASVQMKQMIRNIQGMSGGCSSCGKKK